MNNVVSTVSDKYSSAISSVTAEEIEVDMDTAGTTVHVLPILGTGNFSYGGNIYLGSPPVDNTDYALIQHEIGHSFQQNEMGNYDYITSVAIPSVISYHWNCNIRNDFQSHKNQSYEIDADDRAIDYYGNDSFIAKEPYLFPRTTPNPYTETQNIIKNQYRKNQEAISTIKSYEAELNSKNNELKEK